MVRFIILILVLLGLLSPTECQLRTQVNVKLTSHLSDRLRKRDAHAPLYNVQLTSSDNKLISELSLVPIRDSIFSPNFKLHLGSRDKYGNLALDEVPLAYGHLKSTQEGLYSDSENDAIVKLSESKLELSGVVGGKALSFENGKHYLTEHKMSDSHLINDYEPSFAPLPLSRLSTGRNQRDAPPQYEPELSIVVDASNYKDLREDPANMLNYFSVLLHAVNTRYATIPDFKVNFTIAGITAMKSEADQPFITECYQKSVGGGCDVTGVLMDLFSRWVFKNRDVLPKSDITILVHNVKPGSNGANGAGWIARACQKNIANIIDQSTSVAADKGGSFAGVHTMTHELAHNLGAPHDGEIVEGQDARPCSYSDGYIMSYAKYGWPNKFRFSSCSIELMKSYLAAHGGCLTTTENPDDHPPAGTQGGEFLSMNTQCQTQFKYNPNVFAYTYGREYDEQCRKLICVIQALYYPGDQQLVSDGYYPAELSSCGINGVCIDGACVAHPSFSAQCRTALENDNASVDVTLSPDSLCSNLGCAFYDSDGMQRRKLLDKSPLEFSSCGVNGRCINGSCHQPAPAPDMTYQCQVLLNNTKAIAKPTDSYGIVTPDVLCSYLTCFVAPNRYQSPLPPMDFSRCGETGNVCFRGTCNTPSEHSDLETKRLSEKSENCATSGARSSK